MRVLSIVPLQRPARRDRGASLIEVMIVMTILVVAAGIFSRMVAATAQLRRVNRENNIAVNAGRDVLEEMRDNVFSDVFALYNPDPTDDPGGAGTAPGHLFAVEGLRLLEDSETGFQLEVVLPGLPPNSPSLLGETDWDRSNEDPPEAPGGPEPEPEEEVPGTTWEMREDYEDLLLGMPRDLNGDSMIDFADHAGDYTLLPVLVRVRWQGSHGPRIYEVYTMLADFRKLR